MLEKTFCMIKPDAVARGLKNEIFSRIEHAGLSIPLSRLVTMAADDAAQLYQPHLGKNFYPGLIKFITSGPVFVCVVEGESAIVNLRTLMGDTDPRKAAKGTIRGDLREAEPVTADGTIKNLIHGSDSAESAQRELAIFF